MKTILLVTVSLIASLTPSARAGQLADLASFVAGEVSAKERLLSPEQRSQVSRQLNQVLATLNNGGSNPGNRQYVCTSRDNDGNRPYVIGYKDFASVIRIDGTTLNSLEACENAIAKGRKVFDRLFVCATRDNDGNRPYSMMALNGGAPALKMENSTLNTVEDCQSVTASMVVRREGVLYCGSRDNDGQRPFVKMGYRFSGEFERGNEPYNSLADCVRAL